MSSAESQQAPKHYPTFSAADFVNEIGGGDREFAAELSSVFITDTAERIAQMQEKLAQQDHTAVWQLAHSIKGSAGSLGAEAVSSAAHDLEQAGRQGNVAGMDSALQALVEQFAATQAALDGYL